MNIEQIINQINNSMDALDLVTARRYIEENIEVLGSKRALLNRNARELMNVLSELHNSNYKPITRQEMTIMNAINTYATKFDLRGLKLIVKDNSKLLLREDIIPYLNKDAKVVLQSMGVISK